MSKKETQYLKGTIILLMIYHHLFAYTDYSKYTSFLPMIGDYRVEQIIGLFAQICVTSYLFLSGYGMSFKVDNTFYIGKSMAQLWKMYKVYWLVFLLFVPIRIFITDLTFNPIEFILNFFGYSSTYNYEWWFLFIYALLILMLPLIKNVNINHLFIGSSIIIVLGYVFRFILNRNSDVSVISKFLDTNFWFLLYRLMLCQFSFFTGYIFQKRKIFEKIRPYLSRKSIFFALLILPLMVIAKAFIPGGSVFSTVLTPIYFMACIIIVGGNNFLTKFFSLFGKYSTIIWLTHTFYSNYLFGKAFYSLEYSWLIFAAVSVVSLLGAIVINRIQFIVVNITNKRKMIVEQ